MSGSLICLLCLRALDGSTHVQPLLDYTSLLTHGGALLSIPPFFYSFMKAAEVGGADGPTQRVRLQLGVELAVGV